MKYKWLFILILVIALLAIGGVIYEKIILRRADAAFQSELEQYRADNDRLRGKLGEAEAEIGSLVLDITALEQTNIELRSNLERSREIVEGLADENQRLEGIITEGFEATGGAREDTQRIEAALREALAIVERIERDGAEKRREAP